MTGILLVDKEEGWTSSDVVAKLRGVLHERRTGHAGTLDPLATGLLVVMVGRATRASDYLMRHDKTYRARLRLGVTTDTQDITGRILENRKPEVSSAQLESVLRSFNGEQEQIPPMYSAVKINGQKLYTVARKGGEVERSARKISISSLTLSGMEGEDYVLDISCSAGTYIRTLCHDIGSALGCGGCMAGLRRLSAGTFSVEDAHTIPEIVRTAEEGRAASLLLPVDGAFSAFPSVTVDAEQEKLLRCGNPVHQSGSLGMCRVYSGNGEFLLLGRSENGRLISEKSFFEV